MYDETKTAILMTSARILKKIYGGLKGEIRLAVLRHDIFGRVKSLSNRHTTDPFAYWMLRRLGANQYRACQRRA
ncbi:MAG: hypothetical protein U1E98_04380 [Moraxella osloensis]